MSNIIMMKQIQIITQSKLTTPFKFINQIIDNKRMNAKNQLVSLEMIMKQQSKVNDNQSKKSNVNTSSMNLAVSQFNLHTSGHNNNNNNQNIHTTNTCKRIHNQLKWLNKSRQSIPYRLQIKRILNINTLQKKSNSSNLYIGFKVKMFVKRKRNEVNYQVEQLGGEVNYQCQQPLKRRDQSIYESPTSFYYHSRVNRQQQAVYISVRVTVIQLLSGVVQNLTHIGFFIISNPFTQTTDKLLLSKPHLFEIQYIEYNNYEQMIKSSSQSSNISVQIEINSPIQLKKLTKLIPENTIISPNSYIVGLNDQYLDNQHDIIQIIETSTINLNFKYLQVHIPQTFDDEIVKLVKTFPNSIFTTKDQLKGRKLVVSYHTGRYPICPLERKLEYIDRQQAGQLRILIYQGVKDGETISYPYYMQDHPYPITISLVYEIADKQFQVAVFTLTPLTNGSVHQISEQMTTPSTDDNIFSKPYRLKTSSKYKPTLITQYVSEEIPIEDQSIIDGINNKPTAGRNMRSSQNLLRTSQRLFQDKAQQQRQKQKLIQEIQYEKVCLEKERSQIQKIKNQNYVLYKEEFEKKFQQEKQALNKRQQMLERQYREQVEREIREKQQLQEQIRQMKEKVRRIEQQGMKKNDYYSDDDVVNNPVQSNQFMNTIPQGTTPFPFAPLFPTRTPYNQSINERQSPLQLKQKIDPRYLLETQNSIPVTKVRQIINKKAKSSISKDLIDLSNSQFDKSSVFKFMFTSVSWSNETTRPRQMYFVIRFFNFPEYRTDRVTAFGEDAESGYQQLVRLHQHHYGSEDPTPTYTFTVDPSEYKNPQLLQNDLTSYLAHNNCIVDIFDGQTHIYLGQINIKLNELMRGNKIQTFVTKQYNLINLKTKQRFGSMQILVKNEQSQCKNVLYMRKPHNITRENKKKVISYVPMQVPKSQKPINSLTSIQRIKQTTTEKTQTSKNRLQQRITLFKQKQKQKKLQSNYPNFITLPESDKTNVLARIAHHKQKHINEYIKSVYSTLLHETITISAEFGKAQSFPYIFVNQGTNSSVYKIVIDENTSQNDNGDNDTNLISDNNSTSDLEIVKDVGQWRYLVKRNAYMQPKHYEIINSSNTFHLAPGQSLPMIFRYLTFRNVSEYSKSQQRRINVSIVKIDSNWIAGGFSLTVQLHQQIVHHSYVLYEPSNSLVELVMPVIYTREEEYGPGMIKKLYITDDKEQTQAQWMNQYEILLRMVTPDVMNKKSFHVLLYDDQYFNQLKENWVISVFSYEGVYTQSRPDFTTKLKITLPLNSIPFTGSDFGSSLLSNYLLLNSSDLSLDILQPKILPEFNKLKNNTAIEIWCQLIPQNSRAKQIIVTCTQESNSALIYAWIVYVLPSAARIQ